MTTELTERQTNRQDYVDNACQELLTALAGDDLPWDIEHISAIREAAQEIIVDKLKLQTEKEFYPYIELACQDCGACVESEAHPTPKRYFEWFKLQPDGDARGRNGLFVPDQAEISGTPNYQVAVSIWSRRTDGNPPIRFELVPADAKKMAEHILAAVKVAERPN